MPAITFGKPKPAQPGQKPAPKGITFGAPKPKPKEEEAPQTSEDIAELTRRIRTMEERYNTLQSKTQLIEQNMLSYHKQAIGETKTINSDFRELRREIEDIKDKILTLIKELQLSAKKDEVKILERYINMWEPVNFVTRKEVEEMLQEAFSEK
jgi:DNA repair exonuclease SbcCD ATPase subunit